MNQLRCFKFISIILTSIDWNAKSYPFKRHNCSGIDTILCFKKRSVSPSYEHFTSKNGSNLLVYLTIYEYKNWGGIISISIHAWHNFNSKGSGPKYGKPFEDKGVVSVCLDMNKG